MAGLAQVGQGGAYPHPVMVVWSHLGRPHSSPGSLWSWASGEPLARHTVIAGDSLGSVPSVRVGMVDEDMNFGAVICRNKVPVDVRSPVCPRLEERFSPFPWDVARRPLQAVKVFRNATVKL